VANKPKTCRIKPQGTPIESLKLSSSELQIVTIARYYFETFAHPEKQSWQDAIAISVKKFGNNAGPVVALSVLSFLQNIRIARSSTFQFNNPKCPACSKFLTDHERTFFNIIRSILNGDNTSAAAFATILCETNDIKKVLRSVSALTHNYKEISTYSSNLSAINRKPKV
jgi:hypothetical protein|tara:strand:+ start:325 stop:831 length:507 start_codon:yes stop_codon:yes gene_type:complete